MGTEIERKFLVTDQDWQSHPSTYFSQGYLNRDKNRTVRVRIAGQNAWLTIKGESLGPTRPEFEYAIPAQDATQLLKLCDQPLIEKNRFVVSYEGLNWEVDQFLGANQGLVVAEIELSSADQTFKLPPWIGREVTDEPKYFNSNLSKHPYSRW